jgi:hypothetical protein
MVTTLTGIQEIEFKFQEAAEPFGMIGAHIVLAYSPAFEFKFKSKVNWPKGVNYNQLLETVISETIAEHCKTEFGGHFNIKKLTLLKDKWPNHINEHLVRSAVKGAIYSIIGRSRWMEYNEDWKK